MSKKHGRFREVVCACHKCGDMTGKVFDTAEPMSRRIYGIFKSGHLSMVCTNCNMQNHQEHVVTLQVVSSRDGD